MAIRSKNPPKPEPRYRHFWKLKTVVIDIGDLPDNDIVIPKIVNDQIDPVIEAGWELISVTPINSAGTTLWLMYTFKGKFVEKIEYVEAAEETEAVDRVDS